jgi:hypothetical protein
MTPTTEFPKLLELALAEVQANTQQLVQKYQLANYAQWMLDEPNARLVFTSPGMPELALAVQVLGMSEPSKLIWCWGWAIDTLTPQLLRAATITREWGKANEIDILSRPTVDADEPECWKYAAFSTRLSGWAAMYRGQTSNGFLYLAFAEPIL